MCTYLSINQLSLTLRQPLASICICLHGLRYVLKTTRGGIYISWEGKNTEKQYESVISHFPATISIKSVWKSGMRLCVFRVKMYNIRMNGSMVETPTTGRSITCAAAVDSISKSLQSLIHSEVNVRRITEVGGLLAARGFSLHENVEYIENAIYIFM